MIGILEAKKRAVTENSLIVAQYTFEDNVNDVIGNNDGTPTDITYVSNGRGNKSGSFNGSISHFIIPHSDNLSFVDESGDKPFSISMKVKVDSVGKYCLVRKGSQSLGEVEYYIYYRDGYIWWYLEESTGVADTQGSYIIAKADNYHAMTSETELVVTYDGSKNYNGLNIYIDKVLQPCGKFTTVTPYNGMVNRGADIYVGAYQPEPLSLLLDGELDDLVIHNKELSLPEVITL